MSQLYPLKFDPIYKERIWGGSRFSTVFNRNDVPVDMIRCGESWELSGLQDDLSVVSNGFLKGNTIEELVEIYMDELVGFKVYEKFGVEFPLLFKFLDTTDRLSIQVHPDDKIATERHHAWGKSELWYIVEAQENAELIVGFNNTISKEQYLKSLNDKSFPSILNYEKACKDDVYYIPSGRLHAILEGFLILEIQQTSDITYRIYDWDRVDPDGVARELHTELAVDVLDYSCPKNGIYKTHYELNDGLAEIEKTPYFTVNRIDLSKECIKEYYDLDSFIVYMCIDGEFVLKSEGNDDLQCKVGETVLIPACLDEIILIPTPFAKLLEIYI